ncbi:MAG: NACHT domain-containing protein [Anaerolineae bacterium]
MSVVGPNIAAGTGNIFIWLADIVLGGAKRALNWGWDRVQWAAAQNRYDTQIIKQYGEIRIFGQTASKPLEDIFTDVYVLRQPTALRRFSPEVLREHLWNEDRSIPFRTDERQPVKDLLNQGKHFYIQGKPGAGKTTFMKSLAVREAKRGSWGQCLGKIPIYVSLKEFSESGKTLIEFIIKQFDICHFPEATPFIEGLLKNGKALVLFDGLDEVTRTSEAKTDQRGQIAHTIEEFTHIYYDCHIVITCRIAATEYTFDPSFIYLEIADFAPDQVEAFIRSWFWDSQNRDKSADFALQMLKELDRPEHAGIRDLSRNPLLLTLLCLNYEETLNFPSRRVEIYEESLTALLKKWDASRLIRRGSLYQTLSLGRKQQMFARVAYEGFVDDEILFEQSMLENRLRAYLVNVPELPDVVDIDTEAVLREIVDQHGIFTEQSRGLFSFAHLTFQEYYVAKYVTESTMLESMTGLMARISDDKWREIFLLSSSMLQNATAFLVDFELSIRRLITASPQAISWLHHIDQHAAESVSGYHKLIIRWFYAKSLDPRLSYFFTDHDLSYGLDRDFTFNSWLDDLLFFVTSHRNPMMDHIGDNSIEWVRSSRSVVSKMLLHLSDDFPGEFPVLCKAVQELTVPSIDESPDTWDQYRLNLERVLETQGTYVRFRQLLKEATNFSRMQVSQGISPLEDGDVYTLKAYFRATSLLSDCLKLSYTPDRRGFEERILLPPILT